MVYTFKKTLDNMKVGSVILEAAAHSDTNICLDR